LKICDLCWYFSTNFENVLSRLWSCNFLEFLAFFLPALDVSYLQIQQTKNMLIYKSFTKPYFCRPRQDFKPSRLRLEKWAVSRPRPHLESPSLPNMQWETNILCSKCNVHLCVNQWWSLKTHIWESRSWRLQVMRLWMLQRNSLVKFWKFNDFCLLHLQVRNNQNMSEKARNKKKFYSEVMTTFKTKFWQNAQILKSRSRRLRSWLHRWSKQTQKLFQALLPVIYFNCNSCAFSNAFKTCNKRWSGICNASFDKVQAIHK